MIASAAAIFVGVLFLCASWAAAMAYVEKPNIEPMGVRTNSAEIARMVLFGMMALALAFGAGIAAQ